MRVHRLLTLGPSDEPLWVKVCVRPHMMSVAP
jgi:hypothetical protein